MSGSIRRKSTRWPRRTALSPMRLKPSTCGAWAFGGAYASFPTEIASFSTAICAGAASTRIGLGNAAHGPFGIPTSARPRTGTERARPARVPDRVAFMRWSRSRPIGRSSDSETTLRIVSRMRTERPMLGACPFGRNRVGPWKSTWKLRALETTSTGSIWERLPFDRQSPRPVPPRTQSGGKRQRDPLDRDGGPAMAALDSSTCRIYTCGTNSGQIVADLPFVLRSFPT